MKLNDKVIVCGIEYVVKDTCLFLPGQRYDKAFEVLGLIDQKYKIAEEAYGYEAKSQNSIWPSYEFGDYEAAERLVNKLNELYDIKTSKQIKVTSASISEDKVEIVINRNITITAKTGRDIELVFPDVINALRKEFSSPRSNHELSTLCRD